jgi:hypothetical protein
MNRGLSASRLTINVATISGFSFALGDLARKLITLESQGECPTGRKTTEKITAPHTDRCEGRLFPPEQSLKASTLLAEILAAKPTGFQ